MIQKNEKKKIVCIKKYFKDIINICLLTSNLLPYIISSESINLRNIGKQAINDEYPNKNCSKDK